MKKTYMAPAIEVHKIEAESMICASINIVEDVLFGDEAGLELASKNRGFLLDIPSFSDFDWGK